MNRNININIDSKIVEFLSTHGNLPRIEKERNEEVERVENRLRNKLIGLQAGLESQFVQALRDRGAIPTSTTEQKRFLSEIFDVPFEQMKEVISDEAVSGAEVGRQLTFEDLFEQGVQMTVDSFSQDVKRRLKEKIYVFSEDTFSRIRGDFRTTLTEAYEEGIGIDEAVRRLRGDFHNLRDYRLGSIARTEIQGSQNEGSAMTMDEVGVEFKQWLTVGDSQVRGTDPQDEYNHIILHGEVVKRTEKFSNGLRYPLDRMGPIGEWIQCRCRTRPYIPRRGEVILTTPYYP